MKTMSHKIKTQRNGDSLECEVILAKKGGYERYKIGGVPKGCEGRKEHGGPMVAGPWHFIFGLASVIDNHGGTGAEMAKAREAGMVLDLAPGDRLVIDGLSYAFKASWNGVMELAKGKR